MWDGEWGAGKRRQTTLRATSKREGAQDPSHLTKIPPILGAEGEELRVSPSHNRTRQASEEPQRFPKLQEGLIRGGKKRSPSFGSTPGESLKKGLRVGGGISISLSQGWAGGKAALERLQHERDTGSQVRHTHGGSGAAALLGAGARGSDRLRSSPPGGVPGSGLHFRLSAAPDPKNLLTHCTYSYESC